MSLFKKATNTAAYAKVGFMGFAGSGKTYTAADFSIGLVQLMRKKNLPGGAKPIFMIDTEGGASWIKPMIEGAGIEFHTAPTSAFSDLVEAIKVAEKEASVLIIDSITAFWVEFCETYKEVKKRKRGLEFQDWAYLKQAWRQKFVNQFLNSSVHIIMCGRAGFEYDHYKDDSGKRQIEKSGIKMKSEAETGFEPSLVVLMERETDLETKKVSHVAHVLKDRRTDGKTLDGKFFKNPNFKNFMPHVEWINLGGDQLAFDSARTSEGIIEKDEKREDNALRRQIVVDEIDGLLDRHGLSGTSKEARVQRSELVLKHFKTSSRTEIEKLMPLDELRICFDAMHMELEGVHSRYFVTEPEEVNDAIPDFAPTGKPRVKVTADISESQPIGEKAA